ncbi:MAG: ATP-binding protein [Okeania sp. SIO3I5]|uniref:NB-ARC domain-containing protein n=1 Tax=Okeania sp. SIO3I5 TaxID=2607805 RepID=UPI0013B6E3BE|nr:ATP-binding protein [Okeania sp. SIO3I5]NEQ40135.1 ATP-binding protein [Okeania sp. SIO3I5]
MDVQTLVELTDNLLFTKTGKHLDSLQRVILQSTMEGKKYPEIADNTNRKYNHVKQVGSELWQLLEDVLKEEDVKQSNIRSILEKFYFSHISNTGNDWVNVNGNHINICQGNRYFPSPKNKSSPTPTNQNSNNTNPENYYDLSEAPDLYSLCDRHTEITTLKQWIENHTRIITILGLTGIGKSTLTVELIQQIKDKFDYIIWRNIDNYPSCESLQTNIIQFLSQTDFPSQKSEKISNSQTINNQLIDYLRKYPCLLIFDNLQEIFASGKLAGTYLQQHENYGKFFQQIATSSHQSCLLLLSQEQPKIISSNNHFQTLKLDSLGKSAAAILESKNLTDEDKWLDLINLYDGNPLWLNIIADAVEDLCDGNVAQFLSCKNLYLGDLEPILERIFQRLSELEKQVILWIATQETAVDISNTPPDFPLSHSDLWKAIQSLKRRFLVTKKDNLFAILTALKQYIISHYLH